MSFNDFISLMIFYILQFIIDFDRTGSSPPKQNSMNIQTLYTPSNGQKRFNPFMKDTQSLVTTTVIENIKDNSITTSAMSQQNDENKNIIFADDDENNRNIIQTIASTGSPNFPRNETINATPKKIDDDEMTNSKCSINQDSETHSETPLPEWVQLNESVLIRPYNTSGVISFIGSTHFSVNKNHN